MNKIKVPITILMLIVGFQLLAGQWQSPLKLTAVGPDHDRNFDASESSVAFNTTEQTYFVVWQGNEDRSNLSLDEKEIFGNLYQLNGEPLLSETQLISQMGPVMQSAFNASKPEVVFNPDLNEFMVVWYGDHHLLGMSEGEFEIFAQRIDGSSGNLIGEMIKVSEMGPTGDRSFDAFNPQLAYNSIDKTYLVVWHGEQGDEASPVGSFEIYGQFLTAQGLEIGENDFQISTMGPSNNANFNAFSPVLTFNDQLNEFLVVWYGADDWNGRVPDEYEIYARRIDGTNGSWLDQDQIIVSYVGVNGDIARSAQYPDVAYDPLLNQYLVVWSADDSKDNHVGNEFEIYGQLISANGETVGNNDFLISEQGVDGDNNFDAFRPKVVMLPEIGQYIVAWRGDNLVDGEFEIHTQRIDHQAMVRLGKTSEKISNAGIPDNLTYDARKVDLAVNPVTHSVIAVWEEENETEFQTEGEFEVFASQYQMPAFKPASSISGSWMDTARDGEGFVVENISDDLVLVVWFTYLPGVTEQAWVQGLGRVEHNRIVVENMMITSGGQFGSDFDPNTVEQFNWGKLSIEFEGCNTATVNFTANSDTFDFGDHDIQRLTQLSGLNCDAEVQNNDDYNFLSATWYDPSHSGEGWYLEYLGNSSVLMYWFTYDDMGNQHWVVGLGHVSNNEILIENALITDGTSFGPEFNSSDVNRNIWGDITFTINGCNQLQVNYSSQIAAYGSGELLATKLTSFNELICNF